MSASPFGRLSLRKIINHHIPDDGCLLLFNVNHRAVRPTVSDTGVLHCYKISDNVVSRELDGKVSSDLYICWKE